MINEDYCICPISSRCSNRGTLLFFQEDIFLMRRQKPYLLYAMTLNTNAWRRIHVEKHWGHISPPHLGSEEKKQAFSSNFCDGMHGSIETYTVYYPLCPEATPCVPYFKLLRQAKWVFKHACLEKNVVF